MNRDVFQESLLHVMEDKVHWAWPLFTSGKVDKDRLHVHFEQEYATYVRDFPVMIGHAYVQCPDAVARRELAENLYEEETGGIAAGKPHPELFLEYARGLNMELDRFHNVALLPAAAAYRAFLDDATQRRGWAIAATLTTIFIEGTQYERGEIDAGAEKRPAPPLDEHPLVRHYGLSVEHLALTRAHRGIEGEHRAAAWRVVLNQLPAEARPSVVAVMQDALGHWKHYRDDVASACGLSKGDTES